MLYEISNTTSGASLGTIEADSPRAAWEALCADIGVEEDPGDDIAIEPVPSSLWRVEDVRRVTLNGVKRLAFTAYRQNRSGAFVHAGQFTAPTRTARKNLWQIAAAEYNT
jgi:hypothetical protein